MSPEMLRFGLYGAALAGTAAGAYLLSLRPSRAPRAVFVVASVAVVVCLLGDGWAAATDPLLAAAVAAAGLALARPAR